MMSGHDTNPIFFYKKKNGCPEHSLPLAPPTSDNISFDATSHPPPPQHLKVDVIWSYVYHIKMELICENRPLQTTFMFHTFVLYFQSLTIFAKDSIVDVWLGFECAFGGYSMLPPVFSP